MACERCDLPRRIRPTQQKEKVRGMDSGRGMVELERVGEARIYTGQSWRDGWW